MQTCKHLDNSNDLIIEPSAGNGSFIDAIKTLCDNYLFLDIQPENDEVIEMDYFDLDFKRTIKPFKSVHVIGNPPLEINLRWQSNLLKHLANFVILYLLYYRDPSERQV